MGWGSFFSDAVNTVTDTVSSAVETVTNVASDALKPAEKVGQWSTQHPVEALAIGAGGYYAAGLYPEAGALSAELAPVSDATFIPVSEIAPYAPASSNAAFESALANSGSASSQWTTGQILSTTSAGLNLAGQSVKLATLGKSMNASTATSSGLTGALAASPIQTPSGLITTTPQGPVSTGAQPAATGGFMGMDNQTLLVIAFAAGTIWYLMKQGK